MSEFKDWPLIARYLSGECSDTERVKVESLANSNPEVQQVMQLMQEVWSQPEAGVEPSDIKKLWTQLAKKAEIIEEPAVQGIKWKQILPFRLLKDLLLLQPTMQQMLRFAAVVVLTISLTWVVTRFTGFPGWFKDTVQVNTVVVEYGKRKTLNLSDGTVVTLDAGSRIDYPAKFKGDTREVLLSGEGYFFPIG